MNINIDFFQILILATAILLVATLANYVLRKRSAALRYGVWCFTILALLSLPFVTPQLPPIYFGSTTDRSALEYFVFRSGHEKPMTPEDPVMNRAALPYVSNVPFAVTLEPNLPPGKVIFQYGNFVFRIDSTAGYYVFAVLLWIFLLAWIGVALLRFFGVIFSWFSTNRWKKHGNDIKESETVAVFNGVKNDLGVSYPVRLMEHPDALVPFSVSFLQPVVFLPVEWKSWTEEELRAVFAHELAHVAKNDFFWQLLQRFTSAFFWFHPLFWYAEYRMRVERELACDDTVLRLGESPQNYANILLELAAQLKSKRTDRKIPGEAVAMARKNGIDFRIRSILNPAVNRRPVAFFVSLLIFALFVGAIYAGSLFTRRPTEQQRLYAVAVENQLSSGVSNKSAKKTLLYGQVFLPDGTAPKECYVHMGGNIYYRDRYFPFYRFASGYSGYSGETQTDNDGRFELEGRVGANTILQACTSRHHSPESSQYTKEDLRVPEVYLSRPNAISPQENNDEITLHLEPTTFLSGNLRYENGEPAPKQKVGVIHQVEPAFGADIPTVRNHSAINTGTVTNKSGQFLMPLWPGEFTLCAGGSPWSEPVMKKIVLDPKNEQDFDLTIPTPLRLTSVKPDGTPLNSFCVVQLTKYIPFWRKGSCGPLDVNIATLHDTTIAPWDHDPIDFDPNPVPVDLCPQDNYLVVLDNDKAFGIVKRIDPKWMGEGKTLTLRPTIPCKAKLVHKNGEPVVNADVTLFVQIVSYEFNGSYMRRDNAIGSNAYFKTKEDGSIEFQTPAFEEPYDDISFYFETGKANGGGGETHRTGGWFPRKPLKEFPGFRPTGSEPLDLGTITVER